MHKENGEEGNNSTLRKLMRKLCVLAGALTRQILCVRKKREKVLVLLAVGKTHTNRTL